MKLMHVLQAASVLLPLTAVGCKQRVPVGGCPYDEIAVSPQFVTPWGTVLEEDMAALVGPYPGTFTWFDGEEVIAVPKAGQAIEVEAEVDIDLSTARMYEYIKAPDRKAACESDRLFVDAEVSFVRRDDHEIELAVPVIVYRDSEPDLYNADAETPVQDFAPDLVPMEELESQSIFTDMRWAYDTGNLHAEFTYFGQSTDSPSTGHGAFKRVAEFVPDE